MCMPLHIKSKSDLGIKTINNLTTPQESDGIVYENFDINSNDIITAEVFTVYNQWRNINYAYSSGGTIFVWDVPETYRNRPCKIKYFQK